MTLFSECIPIKWHMIVFWLFNRIWPSWLLSHRPFLLLVTAKLGAAQGLCHRKYLSPLLSLLPYIFWMLSGSLVLTNTDTLRHFPICLYCDLIGILQNRGINMYAQAVIWNQKAWDYFPNLTTVFLWLHSWFNKCLLYQTVVDDIFFLKYCL